MRQCLACSDHAATEPPGSIFRSAPRQSPLAGRDIVDDRAAPAALSAVVPIRTLIAN